MSARQLGFGWSLLKLNVEYSILTFDYTRFSLWGSHLLPMSSILQVAFLESPRVWNVSQPEYPSRRVPERKTGATCPNLGKCLLNPSAVKHCPGCRLQKCLRWKGTKHLTFEEVSIHLVLITSVGMDLGQVLNEDQRKERFSHSLQQKRAHKQMSGEADGASTSTLNSRIVTSLAKAPKLETRTLLQKFLDGRKPENQSKFGVDSPVNEAQSPTIQSHIGSHGYLGVI